jgi:hypothetical protein
MREGVTLAGRYRLGELLGQGAAGSTWRAVDAASGKPVVVKALELRRLEGWKDVELLEREARVLRNLDHERIPRYVDSFREDREGSSLFVLVQEHIPGTSLEAWVSSGWRGTETEIRALGAQVLHILGYIHSLRPPLIHRDLNPKNLIRREDGQVFLVDFGGVQDAIRLESGASATVIGTPGYMPMEQYVGRATVRSDYYAFAATLLFLLSHRSPADFPLKELKVDFSGLTGLSRDLELILGNWLEPDEARRTLSPENALALLEGRPAGRTPRPKAAATEATPAEVPRQPQGSRVEVTETADSLTIRFREWGRRRLPLAGFTLVWLGFLAVWDLFALSLGAPVVFVLFSIPFWAVGLFMLYKTLYGLFGNVSLELSASRGLRFVRKFLKEKETSAPLCEVGQCAVRSTYRINNVSQYALELEVGTRTLKFGEFLAAREKQWLAGLINRKVEELSTLLA